MTQTTLPNTQHTDIAPGWARALGGRKFILALIVIAVASVGLFVGLVSGDLWFGAVSISVGAYCGTNAATHWSRRPKISEMFRAENVDEVHIDPNAG